MNESILLDLKAIVETAKTHEGYAFKRILNIATEAIKKWEDSSGKETGLGTWREEYKKAWYRDNTNFFCETDKIEAWEEAERHANQVFPYIKRYLTESVPPYKEEETAMSKELWNWIRIEAGLLCLKECNGETKYQRMLEDFAISLHRHIHPPYKEEVIETGRIDEDGDVVFEIKKSYKEEVEEKEFGNHSPFDSDACLEWGLYCLAQKHDPDIPVKMTRKEFESKLQSK